jgi:hypothetical protein
MKKHIVLFLVITLLGMNCATYEKGEGINLEPGQKPGANLVVQEKDGQQVKGELIAVKKTSLLLKDSKSGVDVSVDINNVNAIKMKKSKTMVGVGLGFFAGAAVGAMIGLIVHGAFIGDDLIWEEQYSVLVGSTIGGLVGSISGGIIGANYSKTILIKGKSEKEINVILEDFRKKARIPDFQ